MTDHAHDMLLLITNLSQHKGKDNIIKLFSQGVQTLVPSCSFTWQEGTPSPDQDAFEVQTRNNLFGYFAVSDSCKVTPELRGLLQNAVQMLAVILERIEQEEALDLYRTQLEKIVDDKTHDQIIREIRYRNLFESMVQGVVYQDSSGKITAANPAAERILGLSLDQMQGRSSMDPRWRSIRDDGSPFPGEEHPSMIALKTGKEVRNVIMGVYNPLKEEVTWININATPQIRPGEEIPSQVFTTFEDITDRQRDMEEISQLIHRQDSILAAIPDIIMEVNDQKVYTWANPAGKDFFGEEVIGKPADYYFAGEQDTYQKVKPIFNGHEDVIYLESWQRRRDGQVRLLAWWCRVLKEAKGTVKGALSTARDITEQRQTEIALHERNEFIESMIRLQPSILYIYDLIHKKNIFSNDGIQRILGYSVEEVQTMGNQVIPTLMYPEDLVVYLNETLPRYRSAGEGEIIEHQFRMQNKNGSWHWLTCAETIYKRTPDGAPQQVLGVIHDITERVKAEQAVQTMNLELEERVRERTEQLERVNAELEAFAYSVSHDLRAPLRSIEGYSNILKKRYTPLLDEEGKRFLDTICKSTLRLDTLITDLLDLSRISRRELRQHPFSMHELVESVIREIVPVEEFQALDLEIQALPDIKGDEGLIRQVWVNLISNAIKYTGTREIRSIQIGAKTSDRQVTYWIKDHGIGFKNQFAEKIFGVFQRLHTEDEFEGTGVGLAIVDRIIKRHGGRAWAEGEEGVGATFYFSLPVVSD